jgi:hypothetical protein
MKQSRAKQHATSSKGAIKRKIKREGERLESREVAHLAEDNLRREVLGSAAKCVCSALDVFSEAKVSDFQVATRIDQNVLRFQIAIENVERVEILESKHHLAGVCSCVNLAAQTYKRLQMGAQRTQHSINR